MNSIYQEVINFYNDEEIDYENIAKLIAINLAKGQNKFYLSADNFNFNYFSAAERKEYYRKIVELMPLKAEFILGLDFDSFKDYQELIGELESYPQNFELLIKYNQLEAENTVQKYEKYLSLFKLLDAKNERSFYLDIDSETLTTFERQQLLKNISEINDLKGLIIKSSYQHDLDISEVLKFKNELNGDFNLLGKADDFYYLNLDNGIPTVSKYVNLLPELFKKIENEFQNNNLSKAREYQLKLNDFIIFVNKIGEAESFKFLLAEKLGSASGSLNSLKKAKKEALWAEYKKIREIK